MAVLRDIKHRIRTVREIQKITSAMKMVAVAKLRKVQKQQEAFEPFRSSVDGLFCRTRQLVDEKDQPFLQDGKGGKTWVIVLTSDRGLCGVYNHSIEKAVENLAAKEREAAITLLVSGRNGWNYFRRRRLPIFQLDLPESGARRCRLITNTVTTAYLAGEVDRVFVVADHYLLTRERGVRAVQLLPLEPEAENSRESGSPPAETGPGKRLSSYLMEPGVNAVFSRLCRLFLLCRLYKFFLDSEAAEQFARMTAMDLATSNADDLIFDLTLSFNKARQEAITKELLDILGGSRVSDV